MILALSAIVVLAAGYVLGRYQPLHRASNWANWQNCTTARSTGLRHAAIWTVLSAENIAWLLIHPRDGWHAWKHRNDPPPPLSPSPQINPNWVAERQAAIKEQP